MIPHTTDGSLEGSYPLARRPDILSLPLEILSRIFDLLCADAAEWPGRSELDCLVKQLSSVCRAFRTAVLNTVSFWTTIDNDFCIRANFKERMARSKNAPLVLDISVNPWNGGLYQVFKRLVPFKDRWKCLDVHFNVGIPIVLRDFPSLELPYLETLSATFYTMEDCDRLLTKWRFPRVTSLKLFSVIPSKGIFPKLTTFEFHCTDNVVGDAFLEKLMSFLNQTRSLQKLHLDLSGVTESSLRHFSIVELPNLLAISVFRCSPKSYSTAFVPLSAEALACILQALKFPNASEFRLYVDFLSKQDMTDWISSFVITSEVLRPVTSLEVRTKFALNDDTLTQFFAPFPNVQELKLEAPYLSSVIQRGSWELKLNHLRSLHVSGKIVDLCRKRPELLNHFTSNPAEIHLTAHKR